MKGGRGMRRESGTVVKVRGIELGRHRSARALNPNFARATPLIKLIVEISGGADPRRAFRRAVTTLVKICPDLSRHSCIGRDGTSFLVGSENACDDLAHLLEHVVIDLGARLTSLDRVSGVTCGLRYPANRYHIFVECDEKRSGEFAIRLAAWALERSTNGRASIPSLYAVARAYAHVERRPILLEDGAALARSARLPPAEAGAIVRLVRKFRPSDGEAKAAKR